MIKFFRKIRQKLLMENKTSKYFKYAIGEIVLVVIGILIALQINNWNISKQDAIFERKILFELQTSIENDLIQFELAKDRILRKENAIDTMLMVINNKIVLEEKQLRKSHNSVKLGILLSYDKAVFETLKNKGLQKVKSDILRKEITRFYEVQLPRYQQFIDDDYNLYKPLSDKADKTLKQINFYHEYYEPRKDSTIYVFRKNYDFTKIRSKEYKEYLLVHSKYKRADWSRIKSTIGYTKKVLDLLNKEIEDRYKN